MLEKSIKTLFTAADAEIVERTIGRIAFSPDGEILRVNERFLEMFDYAGRELVGRNRRIFKPVDAVPSRTDEIDKVFATGDPFEGDIQQSRRDGTLFWTEVSCHPVQGTDGSVDEVVLLVRDVTGRMMSAADDAGQIAAINTSQAVIHLAMDGTILHANSKFLAATGYELGEVVGRHHSLFVPDHESEGTAYLAFWESLRKGVHATGEYRRVRKDGKAVWLRATYNPILDLQGRPIKIVKYAIDVTSEKELNADFEGQIAAIDKSQCIVTFAPDGTIMDANRNFLDAVGYSMEELEGRHHRMFVDPAHAHSLEYEIFWSDLATGRHRSGEFRRIGRDGQDIWLQATYSPVLDQDGHTFKIVKYATIVTREKLRQADHQGQIAAIHKSQSVVSFHIDGTIMDANDNFLDLTGYRLSQVIGRHHSMFLADEERESPDYPEFWRALANGEYQGGEFKRVGSDGREIWLQASYNPIFDMNGRPFKVVKNAVDVTEQKLRQGDYEGQIAAINKSQCVVSFDMDGNVLDANDNFLELMGYALSQVVGQHHRLFVDDDTALDPEYDRFWADLRAGKFLSSKFKRIASDGSEVWIQASYNPIFDLNDKPCKIVKIASDITADVMLAADLSRAQQEVQRDPATGLPNRLGLREFMRKALAKTDSELALLYLDLDHFKPINDTYGHDVGDFVLRTIARRLVGAVSDGQLVARIGGDEFVVAASNLGHPQVAELAENLIETVSQPIAHEDRYLEVGLSIGVARTPQDTLEEDELFRMADVALYRSKGNKRGTFTFYGEEPKTCAEMERHLARDMMIAIKSRAFEIECDVRMIEDDGVAVRLRPVWNHPELGRIGAETYLRVAEQSGLIVPLGEWLVHQACNLAARRPDVIVSVPIYPKQILTSDFTETLALALRECELDVSRLELSLERGTARVNPESLRAYLTKLREMGATVVADSLLMGEDTLAVRASWSADRVTVDQRVIAQMKRQSNPLAEEIARIKAADAAKSLRGKRGFELDADGGLRSFVQVETTDMEGIQTCLVNMGDGAMFIDQVPTETSRHLSSA
ncbi:PAS domain S-box protein [Palleronia sp. LCG004]|uniref:sensor domain-containing protein n=1 Tax=Palleronia sp. LCG004 TaxID=3079304 RepID=UPI002941D883|nr:PAS domain S-box protein [Palleronia sp. LCG004]WOI58288.1 PAS domain S-box protein [Palleronia sp. LCG004]